MENDYDYKLYILLFKNINYDICISWNKYYYILGRVYMYEYMKSNFLNNVKKITKLSKN